MEYWKFHKFCETSSLDVLQEKKTELARLLDAGRLHGTNAKALLGLLDEYIELKKLFD